MADVEMRIEGGLLRDPDLRVTNSGRSLCVFTLICKPRKREGSREEPPLFMDVEVWGGQNQPIAENCLQSLSKGDSVLVWGRLKSDEWHDSEGNKRTTQKLVADAVGLSLRWNPAAPQKADRTRVTKPTYSEEEAL